MVHCWVSLLISVGYTLTSCGIVGWILCEFDAAPVDSWLSKFMISKGCRTRPGDQRNLSSGTSPKRHFPFGLSAGTSGRKSGGAPAPRRSSVAESVT